nr:hypothetical protein [Candidatus Njordarchaeota archaeon]
MAIETAKPQSRIQLYMLSTSPDQDSYPHYTGRGSQGVKVSDYAEEHEELKTALTKWGTGETVFQM